MLGVRTLDSIPGVLANYLSLLPSGWVVHFLHGARNAEAVLSSQTLQHALAKGSLRLRRHKPASPLLLAKEINSV